MPSDEFTDLPLFRELRKACVRASAEFAMIADGDRLLVGVSGGEDSLVLMHLLADIQRRAPFSFELHGVTIDMGFADADVAALHDYCEQQGWHHELVPFPIRQMIEDKELQDTPCCICSRMRRGQIHHTARRFGCGTIVLGHQLDDLCVSLLLSLFRGQGLTTMAPNTEADSGRLRLIRPLCRVPKSQIHELATAMQLPRFGKCDYADQLQANGDRAALERLLDELSPRFPDIRQSMAASMANLQTRHLLDLNHLP